jgi:hypothetical protein
LGTPVIADYRSGAVAEHLDPKFVLDYDNPEEVLYKLDWLKRERHNLNITLDSKYMLEENMNRWKKILDIQE